MGFLQLRSPQPPASTPAADPGSDQQAVQGTSSLRQQAARRSCALLAAAVVLVTAATPAPDVQSTQPETWTQAVQGTAALSRADRQFRAHVAGAQSLYYQVTNDQTAAAQPDTWTSPVDGLFAIRQGQRLGAQRASQAGLYYWQFDDLTTGPLAVQPETWVQPVQGTSALGQRARAAQQIAAGMGRLWQTPEDVTTEPDTWTQPVLGTSALRQQATLQRVQRAQQSPLWQTIPEDVSGPLGAQPDTWPQPVQGLGAIQAGTQAYRARATQTALYWETAQDPPPAVPPDQWTQPVVGTTAVRTAAQQLRARAVLLSPLLWQTPGDVNGPLATQPETWTSPVSGTTAIATANRLFAARAGLAHQFSRGTAEVIVPIEPDTWTSPVDGVSALGKAQRQWAQRVTQAGTLYWEAQDQSTGPLGTQPDTWVQPVQGTGAQATANRLFAKRAGLAHALAQGVNDAPPPIQPETWTSPIDGVRALLASQRQYRQRAAVVAAQIYWQTVDRTTGAAGLQPDLFIQPVQGIAAQGLAAKAFTRRAIAARVFYGGGIDEPAVGVQSASFQIIGTTGGGAAVEPAFLIGTSEIDLTGGYASQVVADGALHYWKFDNTNLGLTDTITGTTVFGAAIGGITPGQSGLIGQGKAWAFDGVVIGGNSSRVVVNGAPVLPPPSPSFSVEAWIQPTLLTTPNGWRYICQFEGDTQSGIMLTPALSCFFKIGGVFYGITGPTLTAGATYHAVATYDGAILILYVNGLEAGRVSGLSGTFFPGTPFLIGGYEGGGAGGFAGTIDEVSVNSSPLSAAQVAQHYALGQRHESERHAMTGTQDASSSVVATIETSSTLTGTADVVTTLIGTV